MTSSESLHQHYARLLELGEEWRVGRVNLDVARRRLDIYLDYVPHAGICPECGALCPLHDSLPERSWRHLDAMQCLTYVHARTPRAKCPEHGVRAIELPWAEKHSRFTLAFEGIAIDVLLAAKTVTDACRLLHLGWDQAQAIMERAVERGLARRQEEEIAYGGMDEKSFLSGNGSDAFASLMTDLDRSRVLEVVRGRNEEGARALIEKALSPAQREMVCAMAVDMSAPYAKAIGELLPNADVVYDKFHVLKLLNKAVDAVRRGENARLARERDRRLAKTKYLWLAGMEHLTEEALARREELLRTTLQTAKAWGLKEFFSCFWRSRDKDFARANFDFWHAQALKSGLRPMAKAAKTLKQHLGGLLAWFDSRIDNALSEGINSVIQGIKAAARGYRNFGHYRIAILFHCGKLDMQPDLVRVGRLLPT